MGEIVTIICMYIYTIDLLSESWSLVPENNVMKTVLLQVPYSCFEAYSDCRLGIGMDASVTPIPDEPNLSLVQTTDFFYPLIDDPYLQVKISWI